MPSLPTKILSPRLPRTYPRARLFALLDGTSERALVWLAAPPGAGKTTLVASYLDSSGIDFLWYHLDAGDADVASLFYYLCQAALERPAAPPLPFFSPEFLPAVFARRFFEELFSSMPVPSALVFDNFDAVPQESPFREVFLAVVQAAPPGIRIFVISRFSPPDWTARLRLSGKMAVIGWPDLRLTEEESEGIVGAGGLAIPSARVARLHEQAQGWAAGIVLLAERLQRIGEDLPDVRRAGFGMDEVFSYFSCELWGAVSSDLRDFLMKTSLLGTMTSAMAAEVSGCDAASRILAGLVRNHHFTQLYLREEPTYAYHPLFRTFLLDRAEERFPADELAELRRRAAQLLAARGELEEAVGLLQAAGAEDELATLLESHVDDLLSQGRWKTAVGWILALPDDLLERHPLLRLRMGNCLLPSSPSEGRRHLERAFQRLRSENLREGMFQAWAAIIDSFILEWNDFTPLDRWIALLEEVRAEDPSFPLAETEVRVAAAAVAALMWRQPHHPQLEWWLGRAVMPRGGVAGDPQLRMQVCFNAANYHLWMGNLAKARVAVDDIAAIAATPGSPPLSALTLKWIEAAYLNVTAEPSGRAAALIEEGLAMAEASGIHIWDHMFLAMGVYSALNHGEAQAAERYLRRLEGTLRHESRHSFCHYHYLVSWLRFEQGVPLQALAHAEQALALAVETGFPLPELLCRLAVAQAAYETGDPRKALRELTLAEELATASGSRILTFMHLLTEAYLLLQAEGELAALPVLHEAFTLGRCEGYLTLFWWWRPQVMTRLCITALQHDIHTPYVLEIVRRRRLAPETPPVHIENWPWPLKIYTMGRFGIVRDRVPVEFFGKAQQKPLALLKAIIALGGRHVAEEELCDILWPDTEGDTAAQSLATTLHRLRKLLGCDGAIEVRDGKVSINPRVCWTDVAAFLRLCGAAERETAAGARKALALYTGHFLAAEGRFPWTVSMRERLRARALRLVFSAAAAEECASRWDEAAQWYQKGLEIDDRVEEFYQRLMRCRLQGGKPSEALAAWNRCRTVLAAAGLAPSPETSRIHAEILRSQAATR